MSVWTKLNQPIGKSGKDGEDAAPAPATTSRKAGRKARAGAPEPTDTRAMAAVPGGGGTATAVLEVQPPADPAPAAPAPAAASRKASGSSSLAAVNLLSPWVLEELAVRRLRMRFLAGGIALLVLVAGTWGVLRMHLDNSREELRGDDAVAAGLNRQIKDMSDVRTYVGAVSGRGQDVAETMAGEVAFSEVLVELREALPQGAELSSFTVTLPDESMAAGAAADPATPVCPGADPFGSRVVVGCIDLTGSAENREQVSLLVQALDSNKLFVEPFVTTTTTSDGEGAAGVEFAGTVGVSPKARSGRYDGLDPAAQQNQKSQQSQQGQQSQSGEGS